MSEEISQSQKTTNQSAPDIIPISTPDDLFCAIEAILFAAGHPVSYEKLSEVLGIGIREIKKTVKAMELKFNTEKSGRGIMLLTYPDTCQLATKERFMPYIREALGIKRGGNLSASTMEALAVVAYNQPVTRSDVDNIRGVDSSYAMTSLIDKNLIEVCGRMEAPGRPMLYATTDKFLRVFGLSSLDDLPATELGTPGTDIPNVDQISLDNQKVNESRLEEVPSSDTSDGIIITSDN